MSKPIIRIENLSKKYQIGARERYYTLRDQIAGFCSWKKPKKETTDLWALKDINLKVERGEPLGVIGRNGAGKSTLLKILAQITPPTRGKITLRGRVASLLEVGTGFHPELTGRENIFLNGAILGMSREEIKKKFDQIVEFAEIERFLDTPVKRYSSGMHVRLAFAVASHLEPEILLIDEVLAVGDSQFQKKCLGKMGEVTRERGRTILFVSHNIAAISQLCSRCILLEKGKIIAQGKTNEVINEYLGRQSLTLEGEVDLTDFNLRVNSLEKSVFKFSDLKILNSQEKVTNSLKLKEPFKIILTGVLRKSVEDLIVGFSIDSVLGFPLFNSFQSDFNLPSKYNEGRVSFEIRFDANLLAPGAYTVSISANGKDVLDFLPVAASLYIEQISGSGESLRTNYGGIMIYPCDWKIK